MQAAKGVVVVTGASAGVGRAAVRAFAKRGYPVMKAIVGEKLVPGYADRYLAEHGYDEQQTEEPFDRRRRDNLYQPVPGDAGAHGPFDERARSFSLGLWASKNKSALFAAAGLVAVAGATLAGLRLATSMG